MDTIFDAFEKGTLCFPETTDFDALPWTATAFEGVALKHIVTGAQTGGQFSFHLVRLSPGTCIGRHIHATQLETHEVVGGSGHGWRMRLTEREHSAMRSEQWPFSLPGLRMKSWRAKTAYVCSPNFSRHCANPPVAPVQTVLQQSTV